jgi:hypothetical protein
MLQLAAEFRGDSSLKVKLRYPEKVDPLSKFTADVRSGAIQRLEALPLRLRIAGEQHPDPGGPRVRGHGHFRHSRSVYPRVR